MRYRKIDEIPRQIPLFPLPGALLLPRGTLPLNIFEPRYLTMLRDCLKKDKVIGLIQPRGEAEGALYEIGCAGRVTGFREAGQARQLISLTGICRFRLIHETPRRFSYREGEVDYAPFQQDLIENLGEDEVKRKALLEVLKRYLDRHHMRMDWPTLRRTSNETLVTMLAMISPYGAAEKQAMLEARTLSRRCDILIALTEMLLAEARPMPGKTLSIQ